MQYLLAQLFGIQIEKRMAGRRLMPFCGTLDAGGHDIMPENCVKHLTIDLELKRNGGRLCLQSCPFFVIVARDKFDIARRHHVQKTDEVTLLLTGIRFT